MGKGGTSDPQIWAIPVSCARVTHLIPIPNPGWPSEGSGRAAAPSSTKPGNFRALRSSDQLCLCSFFPSQRGDCSGGPRLPKHIHCRRVSLQNSTFSSFLYSYHSSSHFLTKTPRDSVVIPEEKPHELPNVYFTAWASRQS